MPSPALTRQQEKFKVLMANLQKYAQIHELPRVVSKLLCPTLDAAFFALDGESALRLSPRLNPI